MLKLGAMRYDLHKKSTLIGVVLILILVLAACAANSSSPINTRDNYQTVTKADEVSSNLANIISVETSGYSGSYTFSVGIESPDLGCNQYADWWEVLSEDGSLIYRRVLLHSHVGEQPFVRSGGPVNITPEQVVRVRAHMNSGGYGGIAYQGSVAQGFQAVELSSDFAAGVSNQAPLPAGCDF